MPNKQEVTKVCKDCKNFRMHYIRYERGYYHSINYGHCVKPRLKNRKADDKACANWEEKAG